MTLKKWNLSFAVSVLNHWRMPQYLRDGRRPMDNGYIALWWRGSPRRGSPIPSMTMVCMQHITNVHGHHGWTMFNTFQAAVQHTPSHDTWMSRFCCQAASYPWKFTVCIALDDDFPDQEEKRDPEQIQQDLMKQVPWSGAGQSARASFCQLRPFLSFFSNWRQQLSYCSFFDTCLFFGVSCRFYSCASCVCGLTTHKAWTVRVTVVS